MALQMTAETNRATQMADPIEEALRGSLANEAQGASLLRSYQIARERGLLGSAIWLGEEGGPERAELWEVPSGTQAGRRYRLRVEHAYGRLRCPCTASAYGNPACAHRGAVVFALYERAAAQYAAARDFAWWSFWDGVQGTEAMYG